MEAGRLGRNRRNPKLTRTSRRYRKARRAFLRQNPLCVKCAERGLTVAAEELDHVLRAVDRPDLFMERTNWMALCQPCHERKTVGENRVDVHPWDKPIDDMVDPFD